MKITAAKFGIALILVALFPTGLVIQAIFQQLTIGACATDQISLLTFVVFSVAMIGIGIYTIKERGKIDPIIAKP